MNELSISRGASFLVDAADRLRGDLTGGAPAAKGAHQPDREHKPAGESVPAPIPLPKLPAVPDIDLAILPNELRPLVEDAAERARFRPDFAAVAGVVALGSVIGR